MATASSNQVDYLIVGAGMSGLCMGAVLQQKGISSFQILERSTEVGGTWLENRYPNSGCDVPSYLYSFSFAPKHDWTMKYARQPEILQYFRDVCDRLNLRQHIAFGQSVREAHYNEDTCSWDVTTHQGRTIRARYLISGTGQLSKPLIPRIEGSNQFQGQAWHSATWPMDADLHGKRVAVVGNGASTIQFLPEVVKQAAHVTLCQRHPSWIHPLYNKRYSARMHRMFLKWPWLQKLYRGLIYLDCEYHIIALIDMDIAHRVYRWWLERDMRRRVRPELHDVLIPNYPPGCKRILLSSDYLDVVQKPSVTVETAPIERITQKGLVIAGRDIPVDCIIYGTGFDTSSIASSLDFYGRGGVRLGEAWKDYPSTLFGIATPQFPNLFFLYGPNTNLGHNSIIYMVETQAHYIASLTQTMSANRWVEAEVTTDAVEHFVRDARYYLAKTTWNADCNSWYKRSDGSIPNNWYSSTLLYRWLLRKPNLQHWNFRDEVPANLPGIS